MTPAQLKPKMARIELVAFLEEIATAYRPVLQQGRIGLRLLAPAVQQHVFADREQLTTILGNLIDNAGKHSPAGSEVAICLRVDALRERAEIRVVDHGSGFDPERSGQLFERFFRGEGPPRGGREGLGIGLALARELVDLHGGRIGAEGRPGHGATFWFELPLGSAHIALDDLSLAQLPGGAVAPGESVVAAATTTGGGRLLLVEDHPDLATYLCERLSEHVPVQWATDAEQALALLASEPFAMLVCDVVLPGLDGVGLCRRLKGAPETSAIPVVLISAKAAEHDRLAGLQAGGRLARRQLVPPVVGITGSVGKTSVKDLLAAVLAATDHVRTLAAQARQEVHLAQFAHVRIGPFQRRHAAAAAGVVTLSEDDVHPFGLKIQAATSDFGAAVTPTAGPPASYDIDLNGNQPAAGERVQVRLGLPDGTSTIIELAATAENPPPAGTFLIGVDEAATAANLAAALDTEIQQVGRAELVAASAMQAGNDFFNIDAANPPLRVDGPPFETATALRDGSADTVLWYQPANVDWELEDVVNHSPVPAKLLWSLDEVIHCTLVLAEANTHIVIMSNGGFGGIHQQLIDQLTKHSL